MKNNTKNIALAGLSTALVLLATLVIQFPFLNGYINAGDAIIIVSCFFLSPLTAAATAGLGSALADILAGYAIYAPGTLVIKALMAFIAALIIHKGHEKRSLIPAFFAAVTAELIMVSGYFLYEAFVLGYGMPAIAYVPGNLVQAGFGVIAGCMLLAMLFRIPYVKDNF